MSTKVSTPTAAIVETIVTGRPPMSRATAGTLAALRVGLGFIFVWAFLDKTFGLGYATPSERSWLNGGSPTKGFLSHVEVGPFQSAFQSIAGDPWANWMFMLGLLGIGVALISGVTLRIAAVGATVMMVLMWAAEWPLAQFASTGDPTGSTNPLVDYHIVYALAAIALAVVDAGRAYGLGARWSRITAGRPWLR